MSYSFLMDYGPFLFSSWSINDYLFQLKMLNVFDKGNGTFIRNMERKIIFLKGIDIQKANFQK